MNANKNIFQYKAYNMDPNNETPLECVPNALFKVYGDKSKGKTHYDGKIANGGMDYIKKMLDIGAYLDCVDDNEPQLIEGNKGYYTMDILNLCNDMLAWAGDEYCHVGRRRRGTWIKPTKVARGIGRRSTTA